VHSAPSPVVGVEELTQAEAKQITLALGRSHSVEELEQLVAQNAARMNAIHVSAAVKQLRRLELGPLEPQSAASVLLSRLEVVSAGLMEQALGSNMPSAAWHLSAIGLLDVRTPRVTFEAQQLATIAHVGAHPCRRMPMPY